MGRELSQTWRRFPTSELSRVESTTSDVIRAVTWHSLCVTNSLRGSMRRQNAHIDPGYPPI